MGISHSPEDREISAAGLEGRRSTKTRTSTTCSWHKPTQLSGRGSCPRRWPVRRARPASVRNWAPSRAKFDTGNRHRSRAVVSKPRAAWPMNNTERQRKERTPPDGGSEGRYRVPSLSASRIYCTRSMPKARSASLAPACGGFSGNHSKLCWAGACSGLLHSDDQARLCWKRHNRPTDGDSAISGGARSRRSQRYLAVHGGHRHRAAG